MPRVKIYTEPRTDIHFRIDTEKYKRAYSLAERAGLTFNKYLEKLLDDDLLLQAAEERKARLAALKGESE